ncbi:hypothetical protein IQ235_14050 [Oscillatoriales cyanobacterium LEGE 11467]|uniref:Uncharacterized protein n=1 Tax=Zarconia navalis LEGE 11467 TaxID=1828826 RepID=A0A928VXF3_9CYAN|nr:putative nucleotide-diphospho-sugar transferase [Zarconia navalis]MBE9041901.1 hypothetical protein [Zarconia navalis LEGE 11467]
MRWFVALNSTCQTYEFYAHMIRVAVASAIEETELSPHLLFDGSSNELTSWFEKQGGTVLYCRSSFAEELKTLAAQKSDRDIYTIGSGAFIRVDIPRILAERGIEDEYILYTDCDVMFLQNPVPILKQIDCRYFAVSSEHQIGNYRAMNTGVMLMNTRNLGLTLPAFSNYIRSHLEKLCTGTWDQDAYRGYYRFPRREWGQKWGIYFWTPLPEILNWKPYWGQNSDAAIVHFHGPKPFMQEAVARGEIPKIYQQLTSRGYHYYCQIWNRVSSEI